MTKSYAFAALSRYQRAVDARSIVGNEGELNDMQALIVRQLRDKDYAGVVATCDRMVAVINRMPRGSFVRSVFGPTMKDR